MLLLVMTEITITNERETATATVFAELRGGDLFQINPKSPEVLLKTSFRDALVIGGRHHGERVTFTVNQEGLVRYGNFREAQPVYRVDAATITVR